MIDQHAGIAGHIPVGTVLRANLSSRLRALSTTLGTPLACALAVFGVILAIITLADIRTNGGRFVYGLDDAYIHMALARTMVLHHVYGVTPYAVSPASSSIVWPWLLAGIYAVVGTCDYAPFVLNVLASIALLILSDRLLRGYDIGRWTNAVRFCILLLIILIVPLPLLCIVGMEHITHAAILIGFVWTVAKMLSVDDTGEEAARPRLLGHACVLAALSTGFRYESLAAVGLAAILLAVRRRPLAAVSVLGAGLVLPCVYAVVALLYGQYAVPNSLMMKLLCTPIKHDPLTDLKDAANGAPFLYALLLADLGLILVRRRAARRFEFETNLGVLFAGACAAHLLTMYYYFFYRYQAYLMALGLVTVAALLLRCWSEAAKEAGMPYPATDPAARSVSGASSGRIKEADGSAVPITGAARLAGTIPASWPRNVAFCAAGLLALVVAALDMQPVSLSLAYPVIASNNIYDQQIRDAFFLKTYYNHQVVMLNDIGAACYFADIRLLDVEGLGTTPMIRVQAARHFDARHMAPIARDSHAAIAIVYDRWVPFKAPAWVSVAHRTNENNIVCAYNEVDYLALNPSRAPLLKQQVYRYFGKTSSKTDESGVF